MVPKILGLTRCAWFVVQIQRFLQRRMTGTYRKFAALSNNVMPAYAGMTTDVQLCFQPKFETASNYYQSADQGFHSMLSALNTS